MILSLMLLISQLTMTFDLEKERMQEIKYVGKYKNVVGWTDQSSKEIKNERMIWNDGMY